MKKPVVDYRQFRLSKFKDPQFSHLLLLLGWVLYFILFFATEIFIPAENCFSVHSVVDDWIPFCEWFVIPYVFWYILVAGSLLYFLFYNVDSFKRLQIFIMITQLVALIIFVVFPTRQDLRPLEFTRDNVCTDIVGFLYTIDTNTGVCPSLHVAYSLGIASVWLKEKDASRLFKLFIVVTVILICLSTVFIKQHSAWDILAALPLCLLAEILVYGKTYWAVRFRKKQLV